MVTAILFSRMKSLSDTAVQSNFVTTSKKQADLVLYSGNADSNQSVLKEIDQSWVFIGRTDAEAETPVLWPPHAKS